MHTKIGIWLLVLLYPAISVAQRGAALALAKAVGLCEESYAANGNNTQAPCANCKLYLVPLQGQLPQPEWFFLEARSIAHCGSGGCTGTVYQKTGQQYTERFSLFGVVDRKLSRPHASPPVIVYRHRTSRYDFNGNGLGESATVWASYTWSVPNKRLLLSDILRIQQDDGSGTNVPLGKWREKLLREWRQDSPWVF